MTLFERGKLISHSGLVLPWKIDCDALSDEDLGTLAWLIAGDLYLTHGGFQAVEGVPTGGVRIASALEPYAVARADNLPILIVDDVWTTGASMEEARAGRTFATVGYVLFNRGERSLPWWCKALFSYHGPQFAHGEGIVPPS